MADLILNVMGEYFNQIKSGEKKEEYRLVTPYWEKRLVGKTFDNVRIIHAYPKRSEMFKPENCVTVKWNGYEIKTMTHPLFGEEPVKVFAIKLQGDDKK